MPCHRLISENNRLSCTPSLLQNKQKRNLNFIKKKKKTCGETSNDARKRIFFHFFFFFFMIVIYCLFFHCSYGLPVITLPLHVDSFRLCLYRVTMWTRSLNRDERNFSTIYRSAHFRFVMTSILEESVRLIFPSVYHVVIALRCANQGRR